MIPYGKQTIDEENAKANNRCKEKIQKKFI